MPAHTSVPTRFASFLIIALAAGIAGHATTFGGEVSMAGERAQMERVEGRVSVVRGGQQIPLVRGAPIQRHDWLTAPPGSRAAILFPDGSRLLMGGGAEVVVEDYLPEDGRQRAVILIDARRGPVRLLLSKSRSGPAKQAVVRSAGTVLTPAPSQSHTDLWTGAIDGTTAVLAIVGRLNVRTDAGSLVLDKKRQGTFVRSAKASPELPAVWPKARVEQALAQVE